MKRKVWVVLVATSALMLIVWIAGAWEFGGWLEVGGARNGYYTPGPSPSDAKSTLFTSNMVGEGVYAHNLVYLDEALEFEHSVQIHTHSTVIFEDVPWESATVDNRINQHVDGTEPTDSAWVHILVPFIP